MRDSNPPCQGGFLGGQAAVLALSPGASAREPGDIRTGARSRLRQCPLYKLSVRIPPAAVALADVTEVVASDAERSITLLMEVAAPALTPRSVMAVRRSRSSYSMSGDLLGRPSLDVRETRVERPCVCPRIGQSRYPTPPRRLMIPIPPADASYPSCGSSCSMRPTLPSTPQLLWLSRP